MERTICFIILIVILLPDVEGGAKLNPYVVNQYTTPGQYYRFKCSDVVSSTPMINFYRSDEPTNPVCSILFNGVSCSGNSSLSTKYTCGCLRSDMKRNTLTIYNVERNDSDNIQWRCGISRPEGSGISINLLYKSADEACSIYTNIRDENVTFDNICTNEKGVNKICVDANTVCSQVSTGLKKCLCDRNHAAINGQCKRVPNNNLFAEDLVNKTISQGRNITEDYEFTSENLDNVQIEIIPNLPNNVNYSFITNGIRIFIFNTEDLSSEAFMIRVRAEYGRVQIQDSTVIRLLLPPPTDQNVELGDECGVDRYFNKICVDSNTVCSEVSPQGLKQCVCDRNYAEINGTCVSVPSRLFMEDFVNATISGSENIIDYQFTTENLDNIQIEIIPNLPNNVGYSYITFRGFGVVIFNTDNLLIETFMIRVRAEFGDVNIQDSTLVHLHNDIPPVTEYCSTVIPQQPATNVTQNVKLGEACGFDNDIYKICIDPHTVCSQNDPRVCQCDRNHGEIERKCVELPNKLFRNKYEYKVILANIEPDKVLDFDLNVNQEYLPDAKLELIPRTPNIEVNGIENDQVQIIVNETKLLQSEVLMLTIEATYGGVKIYDSMLFKLEIVVNTTFDQISTIEEQPNGTTIGDLFFPGFKDFEFVNCPQFYWKQNTIHTNQKLDRDTGKDEYDCKIKATAITKDDNQCTIRDVGDVRITIEDINDNPPVFSNQMYSGKVMENDPEAVVVFQDVGGQIVKITTTDSDIRPNTNITYSVSGGDDLPFSITNNNREAEIKVKTNVMIDYETKDKYTFIIEATDGINKNSATVTIEVMDVNEPAKFTKKNYTFDVSEDDSSVFVGNVIAIDEDKDENYRKNTYNILSGSFNFFNITQDGSLYLVNTAGQKQTLKFELVVSVSDESLPDENVKINVTIHVTDVNESPKFNKSSYTFTVLEGDACRTAVGQVDAYEVDFDENYKSFEFSIASQISPFKIDPETGIITCKNSLDYENKTMYQLQVMAIDKGSPPLNSTTTVIVEVSDDNDNNPILDVGTDTQILCTNIREKDKPVAVVRASDKDSGSNGQLTFSIITYGDEDIFDIDDGGLIFVKLDNNSPCNITYTIGITCSDNGEKPRSVKRNLTVTVSVSDQGTGLFTKSIFSVNFTENRVYSNNQILSLYEYVKPSAQIKIEDTSSNPTERRFSLRNKTLIVNGSFDREKQSEYRIICKASLGATSDIALLEIHIIDVNDNPPVIADITSLQSRSLGEDSAVGQILAQVEASDADAGENTTITYRLLTPNVPFIINSTTGIITTSQLLDRENTPTYELQVIATDGNFTDAAKITVEINDVNDSPPVIQDPRSEIINVKENTDLTAIPINITDADTVGTLNINLNDNCPLNLNNPLNLNSQLSGSIATGELNLKRFDHEEQTKYECVITATDGVYYTNKTLVINVVDLNDNSPVFYQIPANISVDVSLNPGDVLVDMINATDADSSSNGQITFSIEPMDYYAINKTTGEIKFKSLQPDDSTLVITVTATDGGMPPKSTEAKINVTILDDRPKPQFIGLRDVLMVTENKLYPYLDTVKVNSSFGEGQCEFNYSITGDSADFFKIDKRNGNISLIRELDREVQGIRMALVIVAKTECGNISSSSSATLNIIIEDVNDNKPECPQQSFEISQSTLINTVVGTLQASDKDVGYNGALTYFSTTGYFFVENTGSIVLRKKFQISRKPEDYTLNFFVTDPTYRIECGINITIKPDNNNGPEFSKNKYTASLDIGAKKGDVLVVDDLKASDLDNDTITYSLDPDQGFFLINSSTNGPIITLKSDIEVDVQTEIVLKVYAEDDVPPIKTGTCTIEITIKGQKCIQEALYNGFLDNEETATLYQILFYSMVSGLSLCVVLLVTVCYKWRTSNRDKTRDKTQLEKLKTYYYENVNRHPYPYDQVAHPNAGYDAVSEEEIISDPVEPYYSTQANPMYVRASFMERPRFDNLSPRSAMFDEPPPDYM